YLTVLAAKGVEPGAGAAQYVEYSKADEAERGKLRAECAAVAAAIFPGLSLEAEIRSVAEQRLGETVMIREGGVVCGFGVCHAGKGSEAGTGNAYVKFGGVVPGVGAGQRFGRLIESCEAWA